MYTFDDLYQAPYGMDLTEAGYEVRLGEDTDYGNNPLDYVIPQQDILEFFDDFENTNRGLLEASYENRINEAIFKIEVLDQEKFIKNNELQPITNPSFFIANGNPTPDGLLSNEIFGITQADRSEIYAYIDLNEWFIDPSCYKTLTKLNKKFISVVHGTKNFSINEKGELVEDENGDTGIKWLKKNFGKLRFEKADNKSVYRDIRVRYIYHNYERGTLFIKRCIVIPPYFRDVNTSGKYTGVGQINTLYTNLITAARSLKDNHDYGLSMADTTCARIQETLKTIYDWFCGNQNDSIKDKGTGMAGKFGIIRRSNMSKTSDYSSRLVLSAPELKVDSLENMMVTIDRSALPLAACAANFFPYMMYHMRRFFDNEFNRSTYPILLDGEVVYIPIKNHLHTFNDDNLKARLKEFLYSYNNRFIPIEIPVDYEQLSPDIMKKINGRKAYLMFRGNDRYASVEDYKNAYNSNSILEPTFRRHITWCDVIYIAAKKSVEGKVTSITRFPYDSYFNTIYTYMEVSTLKETEPIVFDGELYRFYPKIRQEDIGKNTGSLFIDTLQVSNLHLSAMGADYDGDTASASGSFFIETNEEQEAFMNKKSSIISNDGSNVKLVGNECLQALYNMTLTLKNDLSKLKDPVF